MSQSVPSTMVAGQSYPVSVTFTNTGATSWADAGNYRLGSQGPQDNQTWGLGRVSLPGPIAPGQSATFTFSVTAPAVPGAYLFQWRMLQELVEWFGDFTPGTVVNVVAPGTPLNGSSFVSQSVPPTMTAGQSCPVTVTMQNAGTATWTGAAAYSLGSQSPQDNSTWGLGRVLLPNSVAPGQSVTFSFNVTAPSTPGSYPFQWRMVQDGVQWFGDFTPSTSVNVTAPPTQAPGNIAVTGHDDDLHETFQSYLGTDKVHAAAIVGFARRGAPDPTRKVLIFDHGSECGQLMSDLGVPCDLVDPDAGVPDPSLFDVGKYSAIGVASNMDAGDTDNTAASSANLLAAKQYFQAFNAAGGGLFAFAGVDDPNYYGFLPRPVSSTFLDQVTGGFTQTALGASLGVPAVNDNPTHNYFAPPGTGGEDAGWQAVEEYGAYPETLFYFGAGAPGPTPGPTIGTVMANPDPVTGTTTQLSVTASGSGLSYAWATAAGDPSGVTYSLNNAAGAAATTATFTQAGTYHFTVTVTDIAGQTVTGAVTVLVRQTPTTITVTPPSVGVAPGATVAFAATVSDQFGAALSPHPPLVWGVSGGGTIDGGGLFSAGATVGGPYTVTAQADGLTGTAGVTVSTLTAPADLSAYATGSGRVTLYWTQVPGAAGYNVYRGTAAGGEDYAHPVNGAAPVGAPSYPGSGLDMFTDTGLADGTEYFYTVEAVGGGTSSQSSNEDSDVPDSAAVPWDTRDPGPVLSAFRNVFSTDEPYLSNLRVVGPDGTIYDDVYSTAQMPDGVLDLATNQVTLPDGDITTLFNDSSSPQQTGAAVPAPAGFASPSTMQGLLLAPGNGPFRRVQTTAGWRGVKGYVTLPSNVTIGANTIDQQPGPNQGNSSDAPHIYLGLHDGLDKPDPGVDAGLIYHTSGSRWQPFMRIGGYIVPGYNALVNVPSGDANFYPGAINFYGGATVELRYYAYNQSVVSPKKVSLLVVDGTLYGSQEDFRSLGGATRLVAADLPNVRMKRVQALAQKNTGVARTGSSFTIPLWDQGNLLGSDGSWVNWTAARTGTTAQGQYDDGSYDGTFYGTPPTGAGANVSWTPYFPIPYYREDMTSISIYQP